MVAEVACVLTVSERTAAALLADSRALTTVLPLTLAALRAGTISWQHARILVDETASLDRAGPPGWRRTSWTPTHPTRPAAARPGSSCRAGSGPRPAPGANATTPASIETRHSRSAADRRVEFVPDRDGMAWLSADTSGRHRGRDLGTDHRRGPGPAGPARAPDPGPAPRRHHRHLAPHPRNGPATRVWAGGVPVPRAQVLVPPCRSCRCWAPRTNRPPGRVRADPAVDGPPAGRRRRRVLLPGPDRPPGRGAAGNRPDQLPPHDGAAALAPAPGRPVPSSRAVTTTPWTTRQTTSWPGPTAAPRASPTWASPARNTTASNTPPPGHPPGPAKTPRRAGPPPQGRYYPASTRTGNHPAGRTTS